VNWLKGNPFTILNEPLREGRVFKAVVIDLRGLRSRLMNEYKKYGLFLEDPLLMWVELEDNRKTRVMPA
jgi:hypothetical protein